MRSRSNLEYALIGALVFVKKVVEVNDEVVILEPAYDTYEACTILAGGKPIFVGLDPPLWSLDMKKLEAAIGLKTKAVIINSPHNPTGKVFKEGELAEIANLCCKHKCLAITDEVYEHITFEDVKHVSLASFPGMKERTIVTSSLSKTFSVTGWRIGWAIAPSAITSAIRAIHSKLTDSAPAPFQEAALAAFQSLPDFYRNLKQDYQFQRDYVCRFLAKSGFIVHFKPQGSCFVFAELPFEVECDDVEYVAEAISTLGVAFVPGCAFFHEGDVKENVRLKVSTDIGQISRMHGMSKGSSDVSKLSASNHYKHRYIRVAFCKGIKTLQAAESALRRFRK